jgi:hypothetical protein
MADEEFPLSGSSTLRDDANNYIDELFAHPGDPDLAKYPFFRKARIDPHWDGHLRPGLVFDGETEATTKTYAWLRGYNPRPGDVVLVMKLHHAWVILGNIMGLD